MLDSYYTAYCFAIVDAVVFYLTALSKDELEMSISKYDLKRLELYSQNIADYHLIMDLLPSLARLHFLNKVKLQFSAAQSVGCRVHFF